MMEFQCDFLHVDLFLDLETTNDRSQVKYRLKSGVGYWVIISVLFLFHLQSITDYK